MTVPRKAVPGDGLAKIRGRCTARAERGCICRTVIWYRWPLKLPHLLGAIDYDTFWRTVGPMPLLPSRLTVTRLGTAIQTGSAGKQLPLGGSPRSCHKAGHGPHPQLCKGGGGRGASRRLSSARRPT